MNTDFRNQNIYINFEYFNEISFDCQNENQVELHSNTEKKIWIQEALKQQIYEIDTALSSKTAKLKDFKKLAKAIEKLNLLKNTSETIPSLNSFFCDEILKTQNFLETNSNLIKTLYSEHLTDLFVTECLSPYFVKDVIKNFTLNQSPADILLTKKDCISNIIKNTADAYRKKADAALEKEKKFKQSIPSKIEYNSLYLNNGICFGKAIKCTADIWNTMRDGGSPRDVTPTLSSEARFFQALQMAEQIALLYTIKRLKNITSETSQKKSCLRELKKIKNLTPDLYRKITQTTSEISKLNIETEFFETFFYERSDDFRERRNIARTLKPYGFKIHEICKGKLVDVLEKISEISKATAQKDFKTFFISYPRHAVIVCYFQDIFYMYEETTYELESFSQLILALEENVRPAQNSIDEWIRLFEIEYHETPRFKSLFSKKTASNNHPIELLGKRKLDSFLDIRS